MLNTPFCVGVAAHKIDTFYRLQEAEVPILEYTLLPEVAHIWLEDQEKVVARTLVTSHAGRGIEVINNMDEFVMAPLYTKFFPKTHEYRVHIFQGDILDITEKRKRNGTGSREQSIVWNHDNEYVFCREDVVCPWDVLDASLRAVEALQLDFGAVDVGYDREHNQVAVFEVNTAPGLVGTTLNKYVEKLNDLSSR
jgi:glutathione synthase/RimK-type ligase-like ATP-grasp enzyme